MTVTDQLSFLNETEYLMIPKWAYIEYKRLQGIENSLKPVKKGEVDKDMLLMRGQLLKALGYQENRKGWFTFHGEITNKFIKTASYYEFIELAYKYELLLK